MICLGAVRRIHAGRRRPAWVAGIAGIRAAGGHERLSGQPVGHWINIELGRLVSALFLHGDWLHLMGNLAYLWVFGLTVERAVGHVRFALLFVVLGGLAKPDRPPWQMADTNLPVIGCQRRRVSAIIGVLPGAVFHQRRMGLWVPLGPLSAVRPCPGAAGNRFVVRRAVAV